MSNEYLDALVKIHEAVKADRLAHPEREELLSTIRAEISWDLSAEQSMRDIADAILAAGYRKPAVVTTAEELDALPVGSVVLAGRAWIKTGHDHYEDGQIGFETGVSLLIAQHGNGATVLHVGGSQ